LKLNILSSVTFAEYIFIFSNLVVNWIQLPMELLVLILSFALSSSYDFYILNLICTSWTTAIREVMHHRYKACCRQGANLGLVTFDLRDVRKLSFGQFMQCLKVKDTVSFSFFYSIVLNLAM